MASILHAALTGHHFGDVYGLGSWHRDDDGFIQALVNGQNRGDNPLKLKSSIVEVDLTGNPASRRVFNLAAGSDNSGTNRVIRIYRRSSSDDFRLVERIDFGTRITHSSELPTLPPSIGYVLVKDHGHGVVTHDFIRRLTKCVHPGAAWYVSSKRWNILDADGTREHGAKATAWLDALRDQAVKLILFQHEAATKATTGDDIVLPEVGNWFVDDKAPTRKALSAIDGVFKRFMEGRSPELESPSIIVLPTRESLIARIPHSDEGFTIGYVHIGAVERPHEEFAPRASALFASLFYAHRTSPTQDWMAALGRSLQFTAIWVQEEANRITDKAWSRNAIALKVDNASNTIVASSDVNTPVSETRLAAVKPRYEKKFDWAFVATEYRAAFTGWPRSDAAKESVSGYGVIERGGEYFLELWRAMSDAQGVISIVRAKRHALGELSRELDQFVRARKTSKSFMIVDDPGGGKSTLVRQLAKHRGLRVLPVNITELTRRVDLLAFFDTVVTTQAQDPGSPLLIFVDEINALLEGHTVYSSFLAPLEDGHYNRDGKSFTIQPCVWLFVGTEDLSAASSRRRVSKANGVLSLGELRQEVESAFGTPDFQHSARRVPPLEGEQIDRLTDELEERKRGDRAQKKSDFLSRLTLPPFVLNQAFARPIEPADLDEEILSYARQVTSLGQAVRETLDAVEAADAGGNAKHVAKRLILSRLLREGHALERVYVGASMITHFHPSVEQISMRVLMGFAHLDDRFTFRDLKHDVERLVNVQRNVVVWDNMPTRFHRHRGYIRLPHERISPDNDYGRTGTLAELCPASWDDLLVQIQRSLPAADTLWTGLS